MATDSYLDSMPNDKGFYWGLFPLVIFCDNSVKPSTAIKCLETRARIIVFNQDPFKCPLNNYK